MRRVVWNSLAKSDYFENIDFLLNRWSERVAQDFVDEVHNVEYLLAQGNVDFQETNRTDIRRCVLCKQIVLFYRVVDDNNVELLRFWNSHQNETRLEL